jgi:hypothetical protein
VSPDTVAASTLLLPATGPSVHEPTVAMPLASVRTSAPDTVPPPSLTENMTEAPASGLELAPVTRTAGDGETTAPTVPAMVVALTASTRAGCSTVVGLSDPQALIAMRRTPAAHRGA